MSLIRSLAGNLCLTAPLASWVLSQLLKFILTALGTGKLKGERLWGSGGMPSAHAATVCSLSVSVGIVCGTDSAAFAVAAIFSLIVMYDACGVRLETGRHAKRLNELSAIFNQTAFIQTEDSCENAPAFHEQVGHTLPQVLVGGLLGIFMSILFAKIRGMI